MISSVDKVGKEESNEPECKFRVDCVRSEKFRYNNGKETHVIVFQYLKDRHSNKGRYFIFIRSVS